MSPKQLKSFRQLFQEISVVRVFLTLHPSLEGFQWEMKASKMVT